MLIVKGAPEAVLALSTSSEDEAGAPSPIDAAARARLTAIHERKAAEGLRSVGVAWRELPDDGHALSVEDERELVFAGFALFADPPKTSASEAIRRLGQLGVGVKIISGDAPEVVRHLVAALDLPCRGLLTGSEIDEMSDVGLASSVGDADLFARVSPSQKVRIIRALQAHGHTVGFIGDGINDAPAIRAADPGVSVDSASDVARAAADLILLDPDLACLRPASRRAGAPMRMS